MMDLLARPEDERDLLARASRWPEHRDWKDLSEETLRQVAAAEGLDFATALLFDRIVQSKEHGPFIERLRAMPEPKAPVGHTPIIGIVPGAFYREDPQSGADGQFVLDSVAHMGFRGERLLLRSFGSLPENAERIRAWVRGRANERIILVSLSKSGAEVKLALNVEDADELFHNVTAWVDLSGLYRGTPLINWLFRHPWRLAPIRLFFWFRGYHFGALRELRRGHGSLLDFDLRVPRHLHVIHVLGFPLAGHLTSPLARRGYRRIASLGPNDGGPILLADVQSLPGLILPVWGADHYLRPTGGMGDLMWRLLTYLTEENLAEKNLIESNTLVG